jgi:hypothetical protein
MEVEHGHDTASAISHANDLHPDPDAARSFQKEIDKAMAPLKSQALHHQ